MKWKIKIELIFQSIIAYLVIRSRQGNQLEKREARSNRAGFPPPSFYHLPH